MRRGLRLEQDMSPGRRPLPGQPQQEEGGTWMGVARMLCVLLFDNFDVVGAGVPAVLSLDTLFCVGLTVSEASSNGSCAASASPGAPGCDLASVSRCLTSLDFLQGMHCVNTRA